MKKTIIIIGILFGFLSTSIIADGKGLYSSLGCTACHGNAGISSSPIYPNLAGQKSVYLVKQLKDFQSGARKDPTMTAFSNMVAGKEKEISDYLASL